MAGFRPVPSKVDALRRGLAGREAAPILARLEDFSETYTGEKRIPGFFDTHPMTPDRVSRVEKDAARIEWQRQPGVTQGPADYLKSLDGLLVGEVHGQALVNLRWSLQGIGEAANTAMSYGYDSVTQMQETKCSLCRISKA